jgi:hypothetical protein
MTRGSPQPTQIVMKAAVYPASTSLQTEETPAPENVLAANIQGPFRRYTADYIISPTEITFLPGADSKVHGAFELGAFVFNSEGVLINRVSTQVRTALTLDELQRSSSQGLQYHQEFSVPAKGDFSIRLVAHDFTTNHLGAIEITPADIKDLSPLKAVAAVRVPSPPKVADETNSSVTPEPPIEASVDETRSIELPKTTEQPKTVEVSKPVDLRTPPDEEIKTLHVYADLVQIPTLVRDHSWQQIKTPIPEDKFSVSLESGPWYRATHVRQEGTDPISLAILLDPARNSGG